MIDINHDHPISMHRNDIFRIIDVRLGVRLGLSSWRVFERRLHDIPKRITEKHMYSVISRSLAAICLGLIVGIASQMQTASADNSGLAKALHVLREEHGKICTAEHTHYAESWSYRTKRKAKARAIAVWRGLVIAEYGTDWGSFRRSEGKTGSCWRSGGGGWRCKVESRPCRARR